MEAWSWKLEGQLTKPSECDVYRSSMHTTRYIASIIHSWTGNNMPETSDALMHAEER